MCVCFLEDLWQLSLTYLLPAKAVFHQSPAAADTAKENCAVEIIRFFPPILQMQLRSPACLDSEAVNCVFVCMWVFDVFHPSHQNSQTVFFLSSAK